MTSTEKMGASETDYAEAVPLNELPTEVELSTAQRLGANVLNVARRIFSFGPTNAPDYMSEHFGHAEKRNDLLPDLISYVA